jgi:hypothetical protein
MAATKFGLLGSILLPLSRDREMVCFVRVEDIAVEMTKVAQARSRERPNFLTAAGD